MRGAVADLPLDTPFSEELQRAEVVELANLTSSQTGIPGTIFISTAMGAHGPRVKYLLQPGRTQPSFSVSVADAPAVVANSLPAWVVRQMAPQVPACVQGPQYRMGLAESRRAAGFLAPWRHLDPSRSYPFYPKAAGRLTHPRQRSNTFIRHSRESGNPGPGLRPSSLDPSFRWGDERENWKRP
jgi:hypothetical protein